LKIKRSNRDGNSGTDFHKSGSGEQHGEQHHQQHHEHHEQHHHTVQIGSDEHKDLWQSGNIEYTGRDSFSNIQAHLDANLPK